MPRNARPPESTSIRDWHARFPDHVYNVERVLAQGDLVMVHSNPVYEPGTRGSSVVDIFRFDKKGMIQFPNLIVERKRVIAEGDLVAIHAHYRLNPEDRGQAVVDIFCVGKHGKILEHWDSVQDVPSTPPLDDDTMF